MGLEKEGNAPGALVCPPVLAPLAALVDHLKGWGSGHYVRDTDASTLRLASAVLLVRCVCLFFVCVCVCACVRERVSE